MLSDLAFKLREAMHAKSAGKSFSADKFVPKQKTLLMTNGLH